MIYFLTKTFPPQNDGGGALLKKHTVNLLKKRGFPVTTICVGEETNEFNDTLFVKRLDTAKISLLKQRIGVLEDYLDPWADDVFNILRNKVTKDDVIFATCGGELGHVKLAHRLKKSFGCKTILHFHDPVDHAQINLEKIDYKFHVDRTALVEKYCATADAILTSTKTYAHHLNMISGNKVRHCYFGAIDKKPVDPTQQKFNANQPLNIVYGGSDGYAQRSSQIFNLLKVSDNYSPNVNFHVFGHKKLTAKKYTIFNHGFLERKEYLQRLTMPNMVGYVSLGPKYFRNCIPSKLFELIALRIPILAIIPYGEAFEFIREQRLGFSIVPGDRRTLRQSIAHLSNQEIYNSIVANIDRYNEQADPKKFENILVDLMESVNDRSAEKKNI